MPEGEAPHPRPGNPCGVCMEVNDDDGNPLCGHDLGCGGTEQLHWFCSPCIANLWSCPLCRRPHRLCTAPPPRETQDEDLTLQTLRTLIRQNVWNDGQREDRPDVESLDVLTDEDPATPPRRPPLARTNLGAARPGRGPHGLRPRPQRLQRRARRTPCSPRTRGAYPGRHPSREATPGGHRHRRMMAPNRLHRRPNRSARRPRWARKDCRDPRNERRHQHQWGNLAGERTSHQCGVPT